MPHPGGSVVSVSDSWPGGCEFDTRIRRAFFPAYFCLSHLKHVRKVDGDFGKKVVLVLVWESQETHVRHQPPCCDLNCMKPQYNQPTSLAFRPCVWVVIVNKVHNQRNSTEIFCYLHWPLPYNWNTVEKGIKQHTINLSIKNLFVWIYSFLSSGPIAMKLYTCIPCDNL